MKSPLTFRRGKPDREAPNEAPAETPAGAADQGAQRLCSECKAPMAPNQDWCVQCGANSARNMRRQAGWYSAGTLTALSAILASGAAAAGVAALTQSPAKEPPHHSLYIQPPATSTLASTTPVTPGAPETLKLPHSTLPPSTSSQSTSETSSSSSSSSSSATQTTTQTTTSSTSSEAAAPLELQAGQLSVYNPHNAYPKQAYTEPGKAFEEGSGTLWRVKVQPGGASQVHVGLLIDLPTAQKIGSIELRTPTPGFSLEVHASSASTVPAALNSKRWQLLAPERKAHSTATIKLSHSNEAFHMFLIWLTKVPAKLAGSEASPGHIAIEELALFPPAG